MQISIDDWADDRLAPDLRDITRQAVNDNHVKHCPAPVPANDNTPHPGRHPLIEYDEQGNVVRALRRPVENPLGCRRHRHKPGRLPPIGLTPAMVHRAAVDVWRALAPANDSDTLPRRPRNKAEGQPDMADCLGDLLLWRSLTGGPLPDWAGVMIESAANDDEPEREKEEIRPSENEIFAAMPEPAGEQHWVRGGNRFWRHIWRDEDIEFQGGRIARLGGFKFATKTKEAPDCPTHVSNLAYSPKAYPERPVAPGDTPMSVPVRIVHRAGELLKYNPNDKGWRFPTEHARERRAWVSAEGNRNLRRLLGKMRKPVAPTPKKPQPRPSGGREKDEHYLETRDFRRFVRATFHSPTLDDLRKEYGVGTKARRGLPLGPANHRDLFLAGISAGKDMSDGDRYSRVRHPTPVDIALDDNLDGLALLSAFRDAHADSAHVLDTAMKAQSYADIAESIGKASPHSGKSALRRACEAFREFRLQFSPTRAAFL